MTGFLFFTEPVGSLKLPRSGPFSGTYENLTKPRLSLLSTGALSH